MVESVGPKILVVKCVVKLGPRLGRKYVSRPEIFLGVVTNNFLNIKTCT